MGAAGLPQGTRLAAERFAAASKRDGCGDFVTSLGAEDGKVIWIAFHNERLNVHECFVRLADGTYMRSMDYGARFDGEER